MELKPGYATGFDGIGYVLIVPYGIETSDRAQPCLKSPVLIVPYGIETTIPPICLGTVVVLIVPYGIETPVKRRQEITASVLIVPYGIETHITPLRLHSLLRVNCTLWN